VSAAYDEGDRHRIFFLARFRLRLELSGVRLNTPDSAWHVLGTRWGCQGVYNTSSFFFDGCRCSLWWRFFFLFGR